jgi:hypothetical protein
MPEYANGKIYKITSGDLTYIGSTCEPTLARRLAGHVGSFKRFQVGKGGSLMSFQLIESGTYEITLIELCPCGSKDELTARERYWIETIPCVNKNIPNRTKAEYRETHKEYFKEVKKQYDQDHVEEQKQYRLDTKEHISERNKEHYQLNKEKRTEQNKARYQLNKERISKLAKEKRDKMKSL